MLRRSIKIFFIIILGNFSAFIGASEASARGGGGHFSSSGMRAYTPRSYSPRSYISPRVPSSRNPYGNSEQHYTQGYVRKNGDYVQGHYATNPNKTKWDNWTTRGNINPHTGEKGTRSPYPAPSP